MPKPGKSECSDWFFIGRDLQYGSFPRNWSQPYIFVLEQSRQIQNLQSKQRKSVNITILQNETTRKNFKRLNWNFTEIPKMDEEDETF